MSGIIGDSGTRSGIVGQTQLSYETGIHTPTVTGSGGGSTSPHASINTFGYTRIGDICYIRGLIYITTVSGMSGYMIMTLPFTSASNTNGSGYTRHHITTYDVDYGGDSAVFNVDGGYSYLTVRSQVDAGAWTDLCVTGYYGFSFSYKIA